MAAALMREADRVKVDVVLRLDGTAVDFPRGPYRPRRNVWRERKGNQ